VAHVAGSSGARVPAEKPSIYLATICYGGQAHAEYMAALLAFRPACAARGVDLQIDLAAGEALVSRGRATLMAKFLATEATHLLFAESDRAFDPKEVFRLLDANRDVSEVEPASGLLMIRRRAAQRMTDAHPELLARLGDMLGLSVSEAVFVFDPMVEPETGRYLTDLEAFRARWRKVDGA
jgi:hypothetical protein